LSFGVAEQIVQRAVTYLRSDASQDAALIVAVLPRLIDLLKSPGESVDSAAD
jgi:hypothetical protein